MGGGRKDHSGRRFGRLEAIRYVGTDSKSRQALWLCRCNCGSYATVKSANLSKGAVKSCGCLAPDVTRERSTTHGGSKLSEYRCWQGMIQRCTDPSAIGYGRYGGIGVNVCARWKRFESFLADVGRRPTEQHTLDRFPNNKGNYEPGNVRWATKKEQARNRRDNYLITFNDETKTLAEWAEISGLCRTVISRRLKAGWPVHAAINTPSLRRKKRGWYDQV